MSLSQKDIKISNAKGLLIFLVVFGHLIEIFDEDYNELFVFIYAFHMPLFIFISGYLAKRIKLSKILNMILLYLIFQTFFNWVLHLTGDYPNLQFTYGEPHFHLWYIVSIGFWYGVVLIINKLKLKTPGKWFVFIVIFAVCFISRWYTDEIVDVVQKYDDNLSSYTLSYQRTLSFMPFFFLGFFITKDWLQTIYNSLLNYKTTIIMLAITIFVTFIYIQESYGIISIFRGSRGIDQFLENDDGFSVYFFKIMIHYLLAFWISYLVFNLISTKESIVTKWGDNSLPIFLFHPISVFVIRQTKFMEEWAPGTKLALYLLIAILVTAVLGSNRFVRITNQVCNPYKTIENTVTSSRFLYIIKHIRTKRQRGNFKRETKI